MSVFRDLASALPDLLFLSGDKRQGRRRSPRTKPGRAGGPTAWLGGRAAAAATGLFTDVIVVSRRRETTHQVPAGTEDIIADVASGPTLTARGQGTATASRALQRGLRMHSTTPTHGGRPCCLPPLRWGTVASLTATRSLTATGTDHRCDDPYDLADRHMTDPPVFASEKFKTDWAEYRLQALRSRRAGLRRCYQRPLRRRSRCASDEGQRATTGRADLRCVGTAASDIHCSGEGTLAGLMPGRLGSADPRHR